LISRDEWRTHLSKYQMSHMPIFSLWSHFNLMFRTHPPLLL
jgi:hypothetical protein